MASEDINAGENNELEESVAVRELDQEESDEEALTVPEDMQDEEVDPMTEGEQAALVEAIVFAAQEPIAASRIKEIAGIESKSQVLDLLEAIEMKFEHEESGIELCCIGGKYQFRTKGRFGSFIREMRAGRPRRLSGQALETLSIIAYRQPIVKSDIEKIRGVDATPTLKTLVERKLIKILGHQASVGQPALYGTTDNFLKLFGMASLAELPSLRDVKELMEDPGESGEEADSEELDSQSDESSDVEVQIHRRDAQGNANQAPAAG